MEVSRSVAFRLLFLTVLLFPLADLVVILKSSIANFDAQVGQIQFITLLRDDGTQGEWHLTAPDCGGLYLVPDNGGGNPCDINGENCAAKLETGDLTGKDAENPMTNPYIVYLIKESEINDECHIGALTTFILNELSIKQPETVNVTITAFDGGRPHSYGSSVDIAVSGSDINLQTNLDEPESEHTTFALLNLPLCGTLTSDSDPVAIGVPFSNPLLQFEVVDALFSVGTAPLCDFSFTTYDQYGRESPISNVSIYNTFPDPNPIVNDMSLLFAWREDNVWSPFETPTNGPAPTKFILTELPQTVQVYQSTNGLIVGDQITNVPTVIKDDLIFFTSEFVIEQFKFKAEDADGHESNVATGNFSFKYAEDFPNYHRCIVNVATGSSTRISLANSDCVFMNSPTDSIYNLTYYIRVPPQTGNTFQWIDSRKTAQIMPTDRNILVENEDLEVLFENTETTTVPNFAEITYSASQLDENGEVSIFNNNLVGVLIINIVDNTPPFISGGAVDERTDEDIPVIITLTGLDLENAQLSSWVNTLPFRGELFQYDEFAEDNMGAAITSNANDIFLRTQVIDRLNRIVFKPGQDENGSPYASFTYLMNDGSFSNLGIASISVDGVPDDPITVSSRYTVEEVSKTIVQLEGYDPEGESVTFLLLNAPSNGTLYQTDQFERFNTSLPLLDGFPIIVEDELGRLMFIAPDIPVQTETGTQFIQDTSFDFQAWIPENVAEFLDAQFSNISTIDIAILGVNNPPITFSQKVRMEEDGVIEIQLRGEDEDPEDINSLECRIVTLPKNGFVSQWSEESVDSTQFDDISAAGDTVNDPLKRVLYRPLPDLVGDPLDSFTFTFFDSKEESFASEISISVTCINDAPEAALVQGPAIQSGSDGVIYLSGTDVDSADPLGYCGGDLSSFFAVIASLPGDQTSSLYQYVDPNDQGGNDGDLKRQFNDYTDGSVPTKLLRGPQITEVNTTVTDHQNRVIFAAVFSEAFSDVDPLISSSSFDVFFEDKSGERSSIESVLLNIIIFNGDYNAIKSWHTIIPIVGAVAFTMITMCFILVVLNQINQEPTNDGLVNEWDIEDVDSDDEMDGEDDDGPFVFVEKPKGLLEGLLLQDNLRVVTTLCDIIEVTDFEEVAAAVVGVFEFHNETMRMIKKLISKEVHEASSAGTLFRSNSMASKVMTAYSKKVGQTYLEATLFSPLNTILEKDVSMEVDPRKLAPGEDKKTNMKILIKACQTMLNWILTSATNAPPQFKEICNHLYNEVNGRFPQSRHSAVGGFLFLRFFCPAIISPDGHGVIPDMPSTRGRRCFVLIAKAIQNLSNGVEFGQKEQFLFDLNEHFIAQNKQTVITFFETMSREDRFGGRPADISPDELEDCLNTIHRHLHLNSEEMCDVLQQKHAKNGSETVASEVASKMTEGLTTFMHTQSWGDATHLDTSDISGLTIRTDRGRPNRTAGGRTHRGRTEMGGKSEAVTQWELGGGGNMEDTDASDASFDFTGSDNDLGSLGIDSDKVDGVPFDRADDEISDFDLSSAMLETETLEDSAMEGTSLLSGASTGSRRSRRRSTYRRSTRRSRMSQMTMTGTDMSYLSERSDKRKRTRGGRTEDVASFIDFGGDDEVELEEIEGGFESDEEGEDHDLAAQLMTMLRKLGDPPGL